MGVKEQAGMGFGHFSIVIRKEEFLPIGSSVCEMIIIKTFLTAQFNDLVFRGQLCDRRVGYFLISDIRDRKMCKVEAKQALYYSTRLFMRPCCARYKAA